MVIMTNAISPVQSFSVSTTATGNDDTELTFQSAAEAFAHAGAEHKTAMDDMLASASGGGLDPTHLLQLSAKHADLTFQVNLFSRVVGDATKGFKTLTQQS
jgi:hypothetical protein